MFLEVERADNINDFDRVVSRMSDRIKELGNVDYAWYRKELKALNYTCENIFDPSALARELSTIQGYKDRAVELVHALTSNYLTLKRIAEVLTKSWPKYSIEKSAEKREGESLMKMSQFIMAANDADICYRYALSVMKNLESQMDSVSRQISCTQVAAKISFPGTAFDSGINCVKDKEEEAGDGITDWEQLES